MTTSELVLTSLRKQVKLDFTAYPKLKDNKNIEAFWRSFTSLAHFHGMADILDSGFTPDTTEQGAEELFKWRNSFMYFVCVESLLTPNTMTYVCEHIKDRDAQSVLAKVQKYMKDSPRANMEINHLVKHIHSIRLDSHYKGTKEHFFTSLQGTI